MTSVASVAHVVFTPSGLGGDVPIGCTVLDAARHLGVDLDSVCGGRGICGRCQVEPTIGTFAKWAIDARRAAISMPDSTELGYAGPRPLGHGRRLGCATRVLGDAVIDVPSESQVHRQVVRKSVALDDLAIDPVVSLAYVELVTEHLGEVTSVAAQLLRGLHEQHGIVVDDVDLAVLAHLHHAVAKGEGKVTSALRHERERTVVVAIWPGFVASATGVAVDVGSTTIAAHLCDLSTGEVLASRGRMNPQIRFGEDLMSRVSYVMMNPGGEVELTSVVRAALDELVVELLDEAQLTPDRVVDVVIVGNPIMHHLVLGIDPTPLGAAPFVLATSNAVHARAVDLGLRLPFAGVYFLPCIAGHVGADTAAAMLAEGPHRSPGLQLLVDIGTNAEIVLGSSALQFAASSPTGPAFEGAQISCGQRATVGAIERVRIDRHTLEPRVKVIGCDLWSDHPDFGHATAAIDISGVCGSGIVEVIAELFLAGVIAADGTIVDAGRSPRVVADGRTSRYVLFERGAIALSITQNDVRAIQLAKAALRAGIELLREHAGGVEIADIRLAGAFGAHIDPLYAMVLGLVPDCALGGVRSVGNAAGAGAVRALLSSAQRAEIETAVRRVVKVETATEPGFQQHFVDAMAFPHATAPTPHLAGLIELPVPPERDALGARARRRRGVQA